MKNTKVIVILLVVGLIIFGAVFFFIVKSKDKTSSEIVVPVQVQEVVDIPLSQRPFLKLIPRADGKEITLELYGFGSAKNVEYEMSYDSLGIPRGVIGESDLSGSELVKSLLLGTCSKNVCRYDEGVSQGEITLKFREESKVKKFNSSFSLRESDKELSSIDKKFYLKGKITKTNYIVASTIGLPKMFEGDIVAGPYGIFSSQKVLLKQAKVVFADQTNTDLSVFAWDGTQWVKKITTAEGNDLTAQTEDLGVFVLAKTE